MRTPNGQREKRLGGDRAMYPPLRGDRVAREGIQREIVAGDGDQGVDVRILRRSVDEIVVVCCVKRRIIKEV